MSGTSRFAIMNALSSLGQLPLPSPGMSWGGSNYQRRGKYGRNLQRTCKLLRRIKTTC